MDVTHEPILCESPRSPLQGKLPNSLPRSPLQGELPKAEGVPDVKLQNVGQR